VKPPDFEYVRPDTTKEAVASLAASDGAGKILAGGQSLVPLMNFRLAAPTLLVDLNHVPELAFIDFSAERLRLGAMTRTRSVEVDPAIHHRLPLLAAAAAWIGHIQIRNRGTVGGSVAHADPAAEMPAICILLDAEFLTVSPRGERVIPAPEFFTGFFSTALAEDEILTEIRMPLPAPGARWGFREFAQRRGDFALAGAAVILGGEPGEPATNPRIVVFGTSDRALRTTAAEEHIARAGTVRTAIDEAAHLAAEEAALDDPRPDAAYRQALTETLVRRALEDAVSLEPTDRRRLRAEVA
jgi:CO/xanthine dehydrogenase FAD-binding subunit